ncbi:hypothetical protein RBSH_05188 [Rhodopirellula baltica SH28]|uniref:Uncharacterized protein n=1 Tax=Rhodopirellula baltica SH28 TaxID=993517 RepID=K5D9F6_RHOBT|nr:hypothetical protein RBSH_05188 [Rhodopirellula baltica SH28]
MRKEDQTERSVWSTNFSQFRSTVLNIRLGCRAEPFAQLIEIELTSRECLPAVWAGNYWSNLTVISILVGRLCGRPDFG